MNKPSAELLDQVPPNAVKSERALLAGFLVRGRVDGDLQAKHYYDGRHATIYVAMSDLTAEFGAFDQTALIARLQHNPAWGKNGFDAAFVAETLTADGNPAISSYHAGEIKAAWRRRASLHEAEELLRLCHDGFDSEAVQGVLARIQGYASGDDVVGAGRIVSRILDTVVAQEIRWLWKGRIPIGKYVELVGDPGGGKTVLMCDITGRITSGKPCPDSNVPMGPGGVVFVSAEDDYADTIRPRLDAAGADCSRVRVVDGVGGVDEDSGKRVLRSLSLDRDISAVEEAIKATPDCKMVIFDPISAYCGRIDSHKNAEVRALLTPLVELAGRHGVAVVGITHFSKNAGAKAVNRGMGSQAWIAAARMVWGVVRDSERGTRLMLPIKANLAKDVAGLSFRIEDRNGVPVIEWLPEAVTKTVDEALQDEQPTKRQSPRRKDVKVWLAARLADGRVPANDIWQDGEKEGFSERLLKWAKKEVGVNCYRDGFEDGAWFWELSKADN
jgi:putative DNA primase/helicase